MSSITSAQGQGSVVTVTTLAHITHFVLNICFAVFNVLYADLHVMAEYLHICMRYPFVHGAC